MFKPGFILSTDAHLKAAIFNRTEVIVWQDGKILDYGGLIDAITEGAVTINGQRYLKATCEFRVR